MTVMVIRRSRMSSSMHVLYCRALWMLPLVFFMEWHGEKYNVAARGLTEANLPQENSFCENTLSGQWYLADDRGRVCPRENFDGSTGCCSDGSPKYDCETCDDLDKCCSSYEHCVSCCMSPEHEPGKGKETRYRGLGQPETGLWDTVFEYCQGSCRTTSRSTTHENAFISDRKFCFSELGRPLESKDDNGIAINDDIEIVGSDVGASCDEACQDKGLYCAPGSFDAINDCNQLRTQFMCEAGCEPIYDDQMIFPGYVTSKAPKKQWPAICHYSSSNENTVRKNDLTDVTIKSRGFSEGSDQSYDIDPSSKSKSMTCTSKANHVQRLCPCQKEAPLQAQNLDP